MMKDCQSLKKKSTNIRFKGKGKKDMITTWSDSDFNDSEDQENDVVNLCFMKNEKN